MEKNMEATFGGSRVKGWKRMWKLFFQDLELSRG